MTDVERVIAAMAKAWDALPEMGTVADMRKALAQAAMREVRLIDAEALGAVADDALKCSRRPEPQEQKADGELVPSQLGRDMRKMQHGRAIGLREAADYLKGRADAE